MNGDRAIPLKKLTVGCMYVARILSGKPGGFDDYAMAIYKGDGEWYISTYEQSNGVKDWKKGKTLRIRKDCRVEPGEGSVKPTELVGPVRWETEEQLVEWLEDYYAGPAIERANLIQFEADPRWLTTTVIDLCRAMRDENNYRRLPILGDALQDAGCSDMNLIAACMTEKCAPYAQRIVALLLGGELSDAVKWLEEFGKKWNFAYRDMILAPQQREGLTAGGIDLHGADELGEANENRYWNSVELIVGKSLRVGEDQFYWSCSC